MAAAALAADQLCLVLQNTLSPVKDVRRLAEAQLTEEQAKPGHALTVLRIVAGETPCDPAVRQAAAVHFKNIVKKGWDVETEEGTSGIVFTPEDRNTIKTHLVQLMSSVPPTIQAQCSESITLIAKVDFPDNWNDLLPSLVQRFNSPDMSVVNGALTTTNGIFKPFRYERRSDELYRVIIYSLKIIQEPLLIKFRTTGQEVDNLANNAAELAPRIVALRTMCRIFYSLNYQDLPEYFQDHMEEWMTEFKKYLDYQNPILTDEDEEDEQSPIDALQAAIIENLYLYGEKDEEDFIENEQYLKACTMLVWNLLLRATALPKHDKLAVQGMKFLSMLVAKPMHVAMFQDEGTLRQIVSQIVIPNLTFRETDEERFDDDAEEFIVRDMQGEDAESRRGNSQNLLRAMCRQFEPQTTAICKEHVNRMLAEYATDPTKKWVEKDVAINLVLGVSIKAESAAQGVSRLNPEVDLMDFFQKNIFTELQDANIASRPIIKAASIKFVSTFRNQFSVEHLTELMPFLIAHLASTSVVVHTYAAFSIEKILTVKIEVPGAGTRRKFGQAELRPFLEPLFTALFNILDNGQLNENQYVMKCMMRALSVADEDVVQSSENVLRHLATALTRVAKQPRNPQFNHFMFESIAVVVRSVCSKKPEATSSLELLLLPSFEFVLQNMHDTTSEFAPYVFQVLAQLLEYRPAADGLGHAYTALFPALLNPTTWDDTGHVPAATRLLKAYLVKAAPELVATGSLDQVLGVFQFLLSKSSTVPSALDLLSCITQTAPSDALQPRFSLIFRLLCTRLHAAREFMSRSTPPRIVLLICNFFALFCGKFGSQAFFNVMDGLQEGAWLNFLARFWLPALQKALPVRMDAKVQVVGITRLLFDGTSLISDSDRMQLWSGFAAAAVAILLADPNIGNSASELPDDSPDIEISSDSAFSKLSFASRPVQDPFPEIPDPVMTFVSSLGSFSSAHPGVVQPMLQQGLHADPKLSSGLEDLLTRRNIALV